MDEAFTQIDFGPLKQYLENDDITDISYSNNGQVWLKTLSQGVYRVENTGINNQLMEKIAFQCANSMGKSFNMANPFLDAESAELRMNFVHDSIAKNGIAVLIRKTPAKIRLQKDKIIAEDYIRLNIHDFLLKCVEGHCNILVSGETGSGKTEFIKYLAAHTKENEKIITIEDTLELHLDKIFPHRDIVAMKTNNIASYSDVLVTCMRQNPRWILLSEVRSAEAVMAVRNSISSGHNILSTIHADKAESIPSRMYSLLETNQDVEQLDENGKVVCDKDISYSPVELKQIVKGQSILIYLHYYLTSTARENILFISLKYFPIFPENAHHQQNFFF